MSPEYIQALIAGSKAPAQNGGSLQRTAYGFSAPKQQGKKKRNFFLDQLSTATSIAGGIGGGILGTAAGGIGAVPGAGIGAAAGGGIGEAIENLIDPQGGNWGNVAKEAALSGVMGAGPIKLAKFAGSGTKALATGADDVLKVANQAAMTPLRQKAGKATLNAADNLAVKNFRLTPGQVTNLNKNLGEDVGTFIRKYGFQNADDVATKGIQPLQSEFDNVVASLGNIPKAQVKSQLDSVIKPLKNSVSLQEQALAKNLQSQADELMKKTGNTLTGQQVLQFRQLFDDGVNYTVRGTPEFNVSKGMADSLRKTLQESADKAGLKAADGRSLKEVGRELSKLRQLDEVVGRQANLGRGSLPLGMNMTPGAIFGAAGGPAGAAAGMASQAAVNSGLGRKALMSGAEKIGGKLAGAKGGQSSLGIAGRLGATGLLKGSPQEPQTLEDAMGQSLENSATSENTMIPSTNMPNSSMMDSPYSQDGQMSSQSDSPFSLENIEANIEHIITNGGSTRDVSEYLGIVKTINDLKSSGAKAEKPLNQSQQERADLVKAIGMTEDTMAGGSINYGPLGSRVEGIKGVFNKADPETLTFKNTVSGLRAAITKARAGASLTPGELKMLAQYTPSDTDSEQVVRSKLAQLRALYGYEAPTGGGSTLEDALMQYQSGY